MRFCLAFACWFTTGSAFVVPQQRRIAPRRLLQRAGSNSLHEFDYILQEGTVQPTIVSRRRIVLPGDDGTTRSTVLASAASFPAPHTQEIQEQEETDPYADALDSQLGKIQQYQERQESPGVQARFKKMDFQDIVLTLFIPGVILFAAGRWGFSRISGRVQESTDATLDSFAKEMLYLDGDFKEMDLCVADYKRRLAWMGPAKRDVMLKRYLEAYAKKKTISPQAITSLSHVFTVFKLSEEKAAGLLVSLCRQMGADKISSAGKLLFLGSRILKSPEGVAALQPIKDLIKSTYRDAEVADTLVETSQHAIAEASYRAAVQASGKNQQGLTAGWEVLGLDRETAEKIFAEEAQEGFVSYREAHYGMQTQKYDKHGNRIDKDEDLENPDEAIKGNDDDEAVSNVYECSECGYTLFVAQGRESKFFGDSFECPECGAPKDKFVARDDVEEE